LGAANGFELRRTARLLLRRPVAEDLDWMTALHADPLNYTHAPDRAHEPRQARSLSRSLLESWQTDPVGYWIVEPVGPGGRGPAAGASPADGSPRTREPLGPSGREPEPLERIGMAGVRPSWLAGRSCFNLYFRFVPAARGRGFAAEACRTALLVAAAVDPEQPVVVRTREANLPARRLSEAIGLTRRPDLDRATNGYVVYVSDW
jgi:ribosomal-protein-alanine N-acetyltransferase